MGPSRFFLPPPRWAVYVYDPDRDVGYGCVVGAFSSSIDAEDKAEHIMSINLNVEAIALPLYPRRSNSTAVADYVCG